MQRQLAHALLTFTAVSLVPLPVRAFQVGHVTPGGPHTAARNPEPKAVAAPPAVPGTPRLALPDEHFRLEWDDVPNASGYRIYVGLGPDVGPSSHVQSFDVPHVNSAEVTGLVAGETYYLTIAARNTFGTSATATPVSGVYGPRGVVAGRAVESFPLGSGDAHEVEAEGALIALYSMNNPGLAPLEAQAGVDGRFRLAAVPAGSYVVGYFHAGENGLLPAPIAVTADGVSLDPLVLPVGLQPPAPGETLVGRLSFSDGSPPVLTLPELGLDLRAELRAVLASGAELFGVVSASGNYVVRGIPPDGYPLELIATYESLTEHVPVASPPATLDSIDVTFGAGLPRTDRIFATQGGLPVTDVASGEPVTFHAEVENLGGLPLDPHWIVRFNDEVHVSTEIAPTFVFEQGTGPGPGDPQSSGRVSVTYLPSVYNTLTIDFIDVGVGVQVSGLGCWSGTVGVTYPWVPEVVNDAAFPATITLEHAGFFSPGVTNIATPGSGYFELSVDPVSARPYLLRIDKPDHMRFLWPFEERLPVEPQFCVIPAHQFYFTQGPGGSEIVVDHPFGGKLTLPAGSLIDPLLQPWLGDVVVQMVVLSPTAPNVLPPTPELRIGALQRAIDYYGGTWFKVTSDTGVELIPTGAAYVELTLPGLVGTDIPGYHQREKTVNAQNPPQEGYFERWGFGGGQTWTKVATDVWRLPLGAEGLFLIGNDWPKTEVLLQADRTLNYPFQVRTTKSIVPVTVYGPYDHDFGRLYLPEGIVSELRVLDVRRAPGRRYDNVASPVEPVAPVNKPHVAIRSKIPTGALDLYSFSLTTSVPSLNTGSTQATAALASATHFLSRGGVNTNAEAAEYYSRIQAPSTLAAWRSANGLPAVFGAPMPSVPADDYSTAYYYNLSDLGFARAQTMRVKTGVDNMPDVAFAVTNYRSIEDARCGRAPVATVCMDYAARPDLNQNTPSRYTRFYVYGSNGQLLNEANLDGAGNKGVPDLCVICHGGNYFHAGDPTTNLGSRFLPFDVESYTFHAKFGLQKQEFARMNAAVMKTAPTAAVGDLVQGWYGTPNPLANPNAFNFGHVPSAAGLSWSGNPALYTDMFKAACRVCHTSRDSSAYTQFSSLSKFQTLGYGFGSACSSIQMPHAQRTWGVFWGSRSAVNLGQTLPNQPTLLGTAASSTCR